MNLFELFIAKNHFKWKEPWGYRIRMKGDLFVRLSILAALGALVGGLALATVGYINNGSSMQNFAGFSAMMVAFFVWLPLTAELLWGNDGASGRVYVQDRKLLYSKYYFSIPCTAFLNVRWPYEAIDACVIVPADDLGQNFSLMRLSSGSKALMIAIPQSVDVQSFARWLKARGINVSQSRSMPQAVGRAIHPVFGGVAASAGLVSLCIGLVIFVASDAPARRANGVAASDSGLDILSAGAGASPSPSDSLSAEHASLRQFLNSAPTARDFRPHVPQAGPTPEPWERGPNISPLTPGNLRPHLP